MLLRRIASSLICYLMSTPYYCAAQRYSLLVVSVPGLVGDFPDDHDNLRRVTSHPEINGIPLLSCKAEIRSIAWRVAVGSALNESLPVNSTDRTRVLLRLDGAIRDDDVSADLALHAVERAVPIRRFFSRGPVSGTTGQTSPPTAS